MSAPASIPQHEAVMAADVLCDAVEAIESGRPALALESIRWALQLLPDCGRPEQHLTKQHRPRARREK